MLTREQWLELGPERLLGSVLDGKYIGFFEGSGQGLIFSIGSREIVRVELPDGMKVTALYHHSVDDCIYLAIDRDNGHGIYKWEGGEALEYVWRSKPFFLSRNMAMTAMRVEGEQDLQNRLVASLYGSDRKRERQRLKVADRKAMRTRIGAAEKEWSIEVRGRARVQEIRLGTGLESLEYGQ